MKYYDRENYQRHLNDLKAMETKDPYLPTTYLRGAFDIACNPRKFNTSEVASGVVSKNDMLQECYNALLDAWENIDWDAIHGANNPKGKIWAFLKKSIELKARERIHNIKDGIRIPHGKRWKLNETKNVDDFLSQLFPNEWFADNDEALDLIDYGYNTRYDIEQLGLAFSDVFSDNLSEREELVIRMSYGIGTEKQSMKNIASNFNISVSNVTSTASKALKKLKTNEIKSYLKEFYDFD